MRPWLLLLLVIVIPAVIVLLLVVSAINPGPVIPSKPATVRAASVFDPPPPLATTSSTTISTTSTSMPRAHETAPTMASKPVPTGAIAGIIRAGFARFGSTVADDAVRVATCESRLDPHATNGPNTGLFQLNGYYQRTRASRLGFTWTQMFDPAPNVAVAADLYAQSGWAPWACRWAA